MDDLRNRLLERLQEDQFRDPGGVSPPASRDLCGHPLGTPALWVVPRDTADVQHIVREARRAGVSVVPVGKRTAYWRPLEYRGAVVLEMSGLSGLGHTHGCAEPVWVGAGVEVRDLDEHLRRSGRRLACHPDAFGDTSIGAMVSTGFAAGCGLGTTGLDGLVAGLVVVLGTGEVLRTGAANALGHAPFTRAGLPDPTGLFYGSDGALGIVTEVAVRPWAATPAVQITTELPGDLITTLDVVELARSLREPGSYETLRCVAVTEPDGADSQRLDVVVRDSETGGVLGSRLEAVRAGILSFFPRAQLEELEDSNGDGAGFPRWRGERGEAWEMLKGLRMVGVDVNTLYGDAEFCLDIGQQLFASAAEIAGWRSLRRGLYASPDNLNLGYHFVFEAEEGADGAPYEQLLQGSMAAFGEQTVVPYRWGRDWGGYLEERLDPTYLWLMSALKTAMDPDGILHPGASLWP